MVNGKAQKAQVTGDHHEETYRSIILGYIATEQPGDLIKADRTSVVPNLRKTSRKLDYDES